MFDFKKRQKKNAKMSIFLQDVSLNYIYFLIWLQLFSTYLLYMKQELEEFKFSP